MTNEELLIALSDMLDQKLKSELQPIKDDVQEMKEDIRTLKAEMKILKADVENLKASVHILEGRADLTDARWRQMSEDIRAIKAEIETEIRPAIALLVENYVPAARRFSQAADRIESMEKDIILIKKVVQEHSRRFEQMDRCV